MADRATQILRCLMDAPALTVEPGFAVESRISCGVYGIGDDLALSVEWRDAEGCLWAADFLEAALECARLGDGSVSLHDCDGVEVVFRLFRAAKRIKLPAVMSP